MLSTAAQKKRSKGIGSSEIAMLVYLPDEHGDLKPLSPWGGRHTLWRRKTGKDDEKKAASYMTRGQYMEDGLMNWYAHDTGIAWAKPKTVRHSEFPYVVDSCDGLTFPKGTAVKAMKEYISKGTGVQALRCLEAKTSSVWKRDEWGEAGTDEVPAYYLVQCQWHMGNHVTQERICDVPMDNGTKRSDYHVHFDEELWMSLVGMAERFWVDYVVADKEPPVDDYGETTKWLSNYMKNRDGLGLLEAGNAEVKLMLQYKDVNQQLVDSGGTLDELKEKLMRAIGEYDGIIVPDTKAKIIWKQSKDTMGIDWKNVAEQLAQQMFVDGALDEAAFQTMKEAHKKVTRKGGRRWTPTALLKNPTETTED